MATTTAPAVAGETFLGCPYSSLLSLEEACSITAYPPCITATPVKYDSACCAAITSYGYSLESCFLAHAPTCLDTSAAIASLSGGTTVSNPCAAYIGAATTAPAATTTPAASTSSGSSAAAGVTSTGSSASSSVASSAGSAGSAASTAASSPSASATGKSDAPKVGAGLKVYIGIALVGALAVLAM